MVDELAVAVDDREENVEIVRDPAEDAVVYVCSHRTSRKPSDVVLNQMLVWSQGHSKSPPPVSPEEQTPNASLGRRS
jgi:hypothetical protein